MIAAQNLDKLSRAGWFHFLSQTSKTFRDKVDVLLEEGEVMAYERHKQPNDQAHLRCPSTPDGAQDEVTKNKTTESDSGAALDAAPCSTPYTFVTHWNLCHESNQLFELDWSLKGGIQLELFGVPPHCLARLASTKEKPCPPLPKSHLQSIRELSRRYFYNTEQLFVPLSVVLQDGREMIGLVIHRDNGLITPQFLDSENELTPHSRPDTSLEAHNSSNRLNHESSAEAQSRRGNKTSDKAVRESQRLRELGACDCSVKSNDQAHLRCPSTPDGAQDEETKNLTPESDSGAALDAATCSTLGVISSDTSEFEKSSSPPKRSNL